MKNVLGIVALLGAGLLSSGCGSSGGALGESPTVSGQLEAWSGGTGYLARGTAIPGASGTRDRGRSGISKGRRAWEVSR